jgi:hypothetical protein
MDEMELFRRRHQREQIRDMHARMAELKQMEDAYGDAGTIAFILGIPVKDVLRVAGDREHDLEEIDPRDLTNTTWRDVMTMCLITCLPPGVMPVREHLDNGALLNPHGSGFAVGSIIGRFMDSDRAVRDFLVVRRLHRYEPAVLHSRNAIGDSPVTEGNIHPFLSGNAAVFHNGYLFPHDGERSDSRIFAEEILPRYDLDDGISVALLEARMGPNKAVILRPGKPAMILNHQLGIRLPDGTWHSNSDYLGISHHVPGFCPQCGTATDEKPVCASCEEQAQRRRALLMRGTSW